MQPALFLEPSFQGLRGQPWATGGGEGAPKKTEGHRQRHRGDLRGGSLDRHSGTDLRDSKAPGGGGAGFIVYPPQGQPRGYTRRDSDARGEAPHDTVLQRRGVAGVDITGPPQGHRGLLPHSNRNLTRNLICRFCFWPIWDRFSTKDGPGALTNGSASYMPEAEALACGGSAPAKIAKLCQNQLQRKQQYLVRLSFRNLFIRQRQL